MYLNAAFDSVIKNKELISEELQDASTVLSDIAEMNLLKRLKNIFKRIRFNTISSKIVKKHIDIFKLQSPNIKGCEVVNKVTDMEMFTNEWILKVFGIGTGAIQTLKVTNSVRYSSTDGHCEILFVPVDIRVQLIVALKDGKPIGRGLKAELVNTILAAAIMACLPWLAYTMRSLQIMD